MTYRILFLLLLPWSLLNAQNQFPFPLTPPRLISAPEFGNPPRHQGQIRIGTGPDMTVVAWADERSGRIALYATRLDREGTVLDPLGIAIADEATPDAVIWNGEDFLVAGTIATTGGVSTLFARLSSTGVVLEKTIQRLGPYTRFADVAGSGPDARILYFENSDSSAAFLFDARGNLIREQPLSPPGLGSWIAASRSNGEFLLLRTYTDHSRNPQECERSCFRVISQRLSSEGVWLSSLESNLPVRADSAALEGGNEGYLLFTVGRGTDVHVLDERGMWTGKKTTLPIGLFNATHGRHPQLLFVDGRFLTAWFEPTAEGPWEIYYGEISEEGTLTVRQRVAERIGHPFENGVAATSATQRLVVTSSFDRPSSSQGDLTFRLFHAQQVPDESRSLAMSASEQSSVAVAAGAEGFAAVWVERGPGPQVRLMFRALSSRGEPDGSPVELARESCCDVMGGRGLGSFAIASNGPVFLVLWHQSGVRARRFSTEQGWLDAEPFVLNNLWSEFGQQPVASNGNDFLTTWSQAGEVVVRRLPATGSMEGIPITLSTGPLNYQPTVASDGADYLVVWSEGARFCSMFCDFPPFRILGSRVAGNGLPIDVSPIIFEDRKGYSQIPAAAWDGQGYVMVWTEGYWTGRELRGIRVRPDGSILDRQPDGTGTLLRRTNSQSGIVSRLIASNGGVLLLTSEVNQEIFGFWDGVIIPAEMPLASFAQLPSHRFLEDTLRESSLVFTPVDSLSVAPRGSSYLVAFTRLADAATGRVPRVFTQLFGQPARPRGLRP